MVFNSRVVPIFLLQMNNTSGPLIRRIISSGILLRPYHIILTKITALQNEVMLSYHRVRELYFMAVVFMTTNLCNDVSLLSILTLVCYCASRG